MFAIRQLKKSELHEKPFAGSTDKEIMSSAIGQKYQYNFFIRTIF